MASRRNSPRVRFKFLRKVLFAIKAGPPRQLYSIALAAIKAPAAALSVNKLLMTTDCPDC